MKKELTILACSWKGSFLLKTFVLYMLQSLTTDAQLIIVLNEADKESIDICRDYSIDFIASKKNYGTLAIDLAIPMINSEYVSSWNDDMIACKGWDKDLIEIVKNNEPCYASCFLVEPYLSGNPVVVCDDLGKFDEAAPKFIKNFEEGKYKNKIKRQIGYMHPFCLKTKDFLDVGGYSEQLNENWFFGAALDDHFPWRLREKYNGKFNFITSGDSCVYHGGSLTSKRLPSEVRTKSNAGYFYAKTGLTIPEFQQLIQRGKEI